MFKDMFNELMDSLENNKVKIYNYSNDFYLNKISTTNDNHYIKNENRMFVLNMKEEFYDYNKSNVYYNLTVISKGKKEKFEIDEILYEYFIGIIEFLEIKRTFVDLKNLI